MKNGNSRILLVEDNADDIELTLLAFDQVGLRNQVVASEDAEEALDRLHAWETETEQSHSAYYPSLVLLDVKLPGKDGFHVLHAIRSNPATRHVPVIMLSSSSEESDILRSYELGANSYLRKPVNFERFVEVARALNLYWLQLNEAAPNRA